MEDVGSKMMFLEASLTMLRDLGAKMANKSAKMIFTVCFSYLHCKSVNFTMCFSHSDAQNARGVAEKPPPGREGRPSAGWLQRNLARGGRAVSLEHCFLGYWSTGGYEEGHWRIEYWRAED